MSYLRTDSLISFKTVDNLFIKPEEVHDDLHHKKHVKKKFRELKIGLGSFNIIYSQFIKLAAKTEFTKEILLQEYMYKLFSCMQDQENSELEYPDDIKNLAAYCQKIYDPMLATDRVGSNITQANTKIANIPNRFILSTRFLLPSSQTTLSSTSNYCPKPRNIFSSLINKEWLKLIKEKKCFYC